MSVTGKVTQLVLGHGVKVMYCVCDWEGNSAGTRTPSEGNVVCL